MPNPHANLFLDQRTRKNNLLQAITDREAQLKQELSDAAENLHATYIQMMREVFTEVLASLRSELLTQHALVAVNPHSYVTEIEQDILTSLTNLTPKREYVAINIRLIEDKINELPIHFKVPKKLTESLEALREVQEEASGVSWKSLAQRVLMLMSDSGALKSSASSSGSADSGLPKMKRGSLPSNSPTGRIHRKALRDGLRDVPRLSTMMQVLRNNITNTRSGYIPGVLHWHINGNAQDNIIFMSGVVLGFVGGHIGRDNPTNVTLSKNCERRRTAPSSEFIDVAVVGNTLYELT